MKKLISVFAALALVGSLAAQKRKAAPKAPAKPAAPAAPAVAAPAAPAVAMPAAPSMEMAGKGMGLFVEGRGTFTLSHGTSTAYADGALTSTSETYKLANSSGFGGGVTIGYEILKGLGLVASYDYRAIKSRTWSTTNGTPWGGVNAAVTSAELVQKANSQVIGIGLRPSINGLGGTIYAGAGFAMVLPFDTTTTFTMTTAAGKVSVDRVDGLNMALGMYGELGYNYNISDNLYVGVGVRALVATGNNDGKSRTWSGDVSSFAAVGASTTATDYSSTKDATHSAYSSTGITDMSAAINVGFRF